MSHGHQGFWWGVLVAAGVAVLFFNEYERHNPCLDRLQTTTWSIPSEGSCETLMPHGRKRCAYPDIVMEGY